MPPPRARRLAECRAGLRSNPREAELRRQRLPRGYGGRWTHALWRPYPAPPDRPGLRAAGSAPTPRCLRAWPRSQFPGLRALGPAPSSLVHARRPRVRLRGTHLILASRPQPQQRERRGSWEWSVLLGSFVSWCKSRPQCLGLPGSLVKKEVVNVESSGMSKRNRVGVWPCDGMPT
jgi:hypothetical protein